MGQKVTPKSFRLGITSKWSNNTFLNSKIHFSNFYKNLNIKNLLKVFLLLKSKKAILVNYFIYNTNNYNSYIIIQFYNLAVLNKKKINKTFFDNFVSIKKKNYQKDIKTIKSSILDNNQTINFSKINNKNYLTNFNLKKKLINNLILTNKTFLDKTNSFKSNEFKLLYYKNNYNFLNLINNTYIVNNYNFNKQLNNLTNNINPLKINYTKLLSNLNLNSNISNIKLFYLIYLQFIKLHLLKKFKIKDKLIFFIILLYMKNNLNKKIFKYNKKFNFNFLILNTLNLIKYKNNNNFIVMNIFKNNLIKSLQKNKKTYNINLRQKQLKIFLNYKSNFIKNVKHKLQLLQFLKNSTKKKLLLKNIFINNLSIIKNKNLSKKKLLIHLNKKNLNYQIYNLNFFKLKKILNIINKLNVKLYFLNIKSLFNFKQLLLDKSVDFEIQNQKTKRYFDIMFKLKKRFNKKWSKIQFLGMDLMNIAQYSLFFKNAKLLTHLISYQLTFLPKNKRQTSFLKYISKIIFNFKGEFKDILGLKIKFKGRFNKWKRTKKWEAQAGNLLVQSYKSLIDYSSVKGLVKKGIFSIRLWIQFKKNSKFILKKKMNNFFQYSIFKQKLKKNESYSS